MDLSGRKVAYLALLLFARIMWNQRRRSAFIDSLLPEEIERLQAFERLIGIGAISATVLQSREKRANRKKTKARVLEMSFQVSTRLGDIYFDASFDTEQGALERAKQWANAGLREVVITHGGQEFTIEQFAGRGMPEQ